MKKQIVIQNNTGPSFSITDFDIGTHFIITGTENCTISMPSGLGRHGFSIEIYNASAFNVYCLSQEINTFEHAHIVNCNDQWYIAVGKGVYHTHDDRYYTEAEIGILLSNKSDATHTHDDRYYTKAEVDIIIANLPVPVTVMYEPLVNGDIDSPEIMFDDDGDIIMVEVGG